MPSNGWNGIFFQEVRVMHPDKVTVIGEAGWATNYKYTKDRARRAGLLNQRQP
ncbi:MAG: hypothetical protein U5L72_19430 [Bacteroidales bacterium]|nr:hypothetical protein [Bacteroidales bacterium]